MGRICIIEAAATPRTTSAGRVYDQLKLMAMTFRFRPGERINEVEVSRQLGVSRTPVREALSRLASEGFVTVVPNRGFIGRMLDATEIWALYDFRCSLEQAIARVVCERASDEELADLVTFAEGAADEQGPPTIEILRRDEEFHLRIARLTKNSEFVRALENVNGRIHFVRWVDIRRQSLKRNGHLQYARLLQARDAEAAAADCARVLRRRYDEIVEVIRTGVADIFVGPTTG